MSYIRLLELKISIDKMVLINVSFRYRYVFNRKNLRICNVSAVIGEKAPNFGVSEWIQGAPTNFDQEKDHIVLVEVFQVNCPRLLYACDSRCNQYLQQIQR